MPDRIKPFVRDLYCYVTVHEFKTHMARYIRDLDRLKYDAVVVQRYGKDVGFFFSNAGRERKMKNEKLLDCFSYREAGLSVNAFGELNIDLNKVS